MESLYGLLRGKNEKQHGQHALRQMSSSCNKCSYGHATWGQPFKFIASLIAETDELLRTAGRQEHYFFFVHPGNIEEKIK